MHCWKRNYTNRCRRRVQSACASSCLVLPSPSSWWTALFESACSSETLNPVSSWVFSATFSSLLSSFSVFTSASSFCFPCFWLFLLPPRSLFSLGAAVCCVSCSSDAPACVSGLAFLLLLLLVCPCPRPPCSLFCLCLLFGPFSPLDSSAVAPAGVWYSSGFFALSCAFLISDIFL